MVDDIIPGYFSISGVLFIYTFSVINSHFFSKKSHLYL